MSKQNQMSLSELKQSMATEAAKRDEVVEQGGRAYRLGIEKKDCPLREPSQRQLWSEGWDKARKAFESMSQKREVPMRR